MRVLVVEDESAISQFLKTSLEAESFAVDVAEDGEKGSSLARTNEYDLMILDNVLPKKFGLQVCREVRESGKSLPILMLSVKAETDMKVQLLNAGADDYLLKPFSFAELLARIKALLRRPKQMEGEILYADDLALDTKKHKVIKGEREIHLTRKEFTLLEYLLRNKGTALSRGMIMEHVWDMAVDPFSNTIESHILSLRKKLDCKTRESLIQTISGVGYKID